MWRRTKTVVCSIKRYHDPQSIHQRRNTHATIICKLYLGLHVRSSTWKWTLQPYNRSAANRRDVFSDYGQHIPVQPWRSMQFKMTTANNVSHLTSQNSPKCPHRGSHSSGPCYGSHKPHHKYAPVAARHLESAHSQQRHTAASKLLYNDMARRTSPHRT
jgi:hypothetical protein